MRAEKFDAKVWKKSGGENLLNFLKISYDKFLESTSVEYFTGAYRRKDGKRYQTYDSEI